MPVEVDIFDVDAMAIEIPGLAGADVDGVAAHFQEATMRCALEPAARAAALLTLARAWWRAVAGPIFRP
jgi:hypothetical protein